MAVLVSNRILLITCMVTIILHIFTTSVSSSTLRNFGSSCSKRKECDSSAGLSCLKGICQCSNHEAHIYSETLKLCVVKVGRRCGTQEDEENNTTIISNTKENPNSICIENADCRKLKLRKWCRCKEGFRSNSDGTVCSPVSRYGESCNPKTEPCDKPSGTECIHGFCQCPFGEHQYFDQIEKTCISYANGNCSIPKVSPCVSNAECVNVQLRTGHTTAEGVKKIHTKSVTLCHCMKGYTEGKSGQCMASAGTECNAKQPCNSEAFLTCVDGKCKCRNPLHEIVDEESGKCVSLVGSTCQAKERGLECVQHAECTSNRCNCKDGYLVTPQKTCLLSYQQSCEPNQCNINVGLACINGQCECFDSHLVFDLSAQACVGLSSSSD